MNTPGPTQPDPGNSYLELRQSIDFSRLKAMEQQEPTAPARPVSQQVVVSSEHLCSDDLLVWEQHGPRQELYIPPADRYNIFIRCEASKPAVQWREGVLDVRHSATGEVVVVPPYRPAYFRSFEPSRNLHLSLAPQMLMRAAGTGGDHASARLRNSFGDRDKVITELGMALLDYIKLPDVKSKAFLECVGMGLAVRLLERYAEKEPKIKGKLSTTQITLINDYLHSHLDGRVTLEGMANLLGMSPYQFLKVFKATVGVPPLRYSLQVRMRRARMLIEGTRKPIGDIAAEVGFVDLSHFTKSFRKHWGLPPSKCRDE